MHANGYKIISVSVQNILAYKYIVPMGIEVALMRSVHNVLGCKYIAPTGVSAVVQIIPTGKKLPLR